MLHDLATLFIRDLNRLHKEIDSYPDDNTIWQIAPGITNSGGNLCLHLVGNLNEFIGRLLGGVPYTRDRPYEFSATGLPKTTLLDMVTATRDTVTAVLMAPDAIDVDQTYPQEVLGRPMTTGHFLIHLYGHLTYHLGQINYHRRLLTNTELV